MAKNVGTIRPAKFSANVCNCSVQRLGICRGVPPDAGFNSLRMTMDGSVGTPYMMAESVAIRGASGLSAGSGPGARFTWIGLWVISSKRLGRNSWTLRLKSLTFLRRIPTALSMMIATRPAICISTVLFRPARQVEPSLLSDRRSSSPGCRCPGGGYVFGTVASWMMVPPGAKRCHPWRAPGLRSPGPVGRPGGAAWGVCGEPCRRRGRPHRAWAWTWVCLCRAGPGPLLRRGVGG